MVSKTYSSQDEVVPKSQIGATLEALYQTLENRCNADEESYTYRLITGDERYLLDKIVEEANEVCEATEEDDIDHLRYEAADVMYHLMVLLVRHGICMDEFAAELNMRMREDERPVGGLRLFDEFVNRGK